MLSSPVSATAAAAAAAQDHVVLLENVVTTTKQREGAGFIVRRALSSRLDPFLMLDHLGPVNYGPREALGAPDHPHRGFQTVTYVLEGEMQHLDSEGHSGRLGPGDVQWMNAGRGVIHSETPSDRFFESGGVMEGFQLWVNLPREQKMSKPDYQEITADRIPRARPEDGVEIVVVAGSTHGVAAAIKTASPILFYDVRLTAPGRRVSIDVPQGQAGFVYVYRGAGEVGGSAMREGQAGFFSSKPGVLSASSSSSSSEVRFLFLAGQPLNEPVAQRGPFVMNTMAEVQQAFIDYQRGVLAPPMAGAEERRRQANEARRRQGMGEL